MKAIEQILQVAQEHIDKCVVRYRAFLAKRNLPFKAKDEEIYRIELLIPLMKSINKYLLPEDTFKENISVNKYSDVVAISGKVIRDSKEYRFETRMIYAGGYNIQVGHYRYITRSTLPKNTDLSAIEALKNKMKKLTKEQKIQEDIQMREKLIAKEKEDLEFYQQSLTASDEEKLVVFQKSYYWRTNPSIRDNPEKKPEHIQIVNKGIKWRISVCKRNINKETKMIEKNHKKLAELD